MDGPVVPPPSLDFTVLPYFNPSQSTPDALILTVLPSGSVTVGESISIQRSMLSKVSKHSKPADLYLQLLTQPLEFVYAPLPTPSNTNHAFSLDVRSVLS